MATIHLKQTTTATPEQLVAAITDFGPGRSKITEPALRRFAAAPNDHARRPQGHMTLRRRSRRGR
jgi:hypothetical protein